MARFYGPIGFEKSSEESETRPSRYIPQIEERMYAGQLLKNYARMHAADRSVDDFGINNDLMIVADPYALNNFSSMKYVGFMGQYWEVTGVTVEYPTLRISFGGVYHGPTANSGQ